MVKHTRRLRKTGGWSLFGSKKQISVRCTELVNKQIRDYQEHIEYYKTNQHTMTFQPIIKYIQQKIAKSGLQYNRSEIKERINEEYTPLLNEIFNKFDDQLSRKTDIYKEHCDKTDPMNTNLFSIYLKDDADNHINLFDNNGKLIELPVIINQYMGKKHITNYRGGKRKQTQRNRKRANKRKN